MITHRDDRPAGRMLQLCSEHSLVDTFRAKHPGSRGYTFHCHNAASRLDRIYVSQTLFPHIYIADKAHLGRSDHVPVLIRLRSLLPSSKARAMPKARLGFWASVQHRDEFTAWVEAAAMGAPSEDDNLILWWPKF
jgi:hypothetical protein